MEITNYQWDALQDIARDTYDMVNIGPKHIHIVRDTSIFIYYLDGKVAVIGINGLSVLDDLIAGAKETGEWNGPSESEDD